MLKENGIDNPILSDKDLVHPRLKDNKVIFKRAQDKFLITGYQGQLGYDIKRELIQNGIDEKNILALDKAEMDITKLEEVMSTVTSFQPDVIFHCAAWTAVDKAEEAENLVYDVNVLGTRNMLEAARAVDAKIVYLSTDYVFDGTKDGMYEPDDAVNPKSVYGKTKYLGEEEVRKYAKHFIARVSWVFGINGNNFIKTMLKLAQTHQELNVVDDQVGSPTYTVDLAHLLVNLAQTESYGTYHVTNEGCCSWAEFAEYIFKISHQEVKVDHVSTEEYVKMTNANQAYRPRNSKLDKSKLDIIGMERLPSWQDATERFCKELELKGNGY
ncbi:MAG: dTDP-4-dehydrorhamnose reductase [Clostridia bacterium]|nr:dTDP-4-dehydrorhamnose reductase [Clostridia bacterium]